MEIYRYSDLDSFDVDADLFPIFIESGGYQDLSEERQKYMYRYFVEEYYQRFPDLFYLSMKDSQAVGYLCFCPDTLEALSTWIPFDYYRVFKDYYKDLPAHLHINIGAKYRGQKIGQKLLSFARKEINFPFSAISEAGAPNNSFYHKNGFSKKAQRSFQGKDLILWSSY